MDRFNSLLLISNPNSAQGPFLIKTSDFHSHSVSDGQNMEVDKMETDEQTAGLSNLNIDDYYNWKQNIEPHTRIAVIGVDNCGKTALIKAIKKENSIPDGLKHVSMRHYLEILVDSRTEKCMVEEIDNGDKTAERREKLYLSQHVALVCFNKEQECANLKKQKDELEAKGLPVIWVKIKKEPEPGPANNHEDIKAEFIVCCPPTMEGVQYLFEKAVREARMKRRRDEKKGHADLFG